MKRLPSIILSLIVLAVFAGTARQSGGDIDEAARIRKAEYIYYESLSRYFDGDEDGQYASDCYEFTRYASALNPADTGISVAKAQYELIAELVDSAELEQAYQTLRSYYFAHPDDHILGPQLADIANKRKDYDTEIAVLERLSAVYPDRNDYRLDYADRLGRQSITFFHYGDSARSAECRTRALAVYDSLESVLGPDPSIIYRQLIINNRVDTAQFINRIENYVAASPGEASVLYVAARLYGLIGLNDSTARYLDRSCEADSTYGQAYLSRAQFYLELGDSARYKSEVANVLRSQNIEYDAKMSMLQNYLKESTEEELKQPSTSTLFGIMQDQYPGEADVHSAYGAYLMGCDSLAEGIEQLRYSINLAPDNYRVYQALMFANLNYGDTVAAIEVGREAAARFTDNPGPALYTSNLLAMREDYPAALAQLDSFDMEQVKDDPEVLSVLHQTRGDYLFKMELTDSAMAEYDTALAYDPTNTMAMNNAAYFSAVAGVKLDRALTLISRAVQSNPDNPTYLDTYAWVLFKKKDYPGARVYIDRALACYGSDSTVVEKMNVYGDATAAGVHEEAVDTATYDDDDDYDEIDVSAMDDEEPEAPSSEIYDHAGDIYFMNGEPEQALIFWEKALALAPGDEKIARKVKYKTYFFE